jgi:hypothetical protein
VLVDRAIPLVTLYFSVIDALYIPIEQSR